MRFQFTISDLGIFLGKAPTTVRSWERKGFVSLPRVGTSRSLQVDDVRSVGLTAYQAGRISEERWDALREVLVILKELEEGL